MIEAPGRLRFPPEPQQPVLIARERFRQDLDRNFAAEPVIARAVDLAPSAGAHDTNDLVLAEASAGFELHVCSKDTIPCSESTEDAYRSERRTGPRSERMMSAEVARDIAALPEVMQLVDAFFATTAADPTVRFPIELALEEVFMNVVKYNSVGKGRIRIDLGIDAQDVVVSVTDFDAPRFDPVKDAPEVDTAAPLDRRDPGGLGIHLVKKMMDRIEYSHRNRTGTITLHKRMH